MSQFPNPPMFRFPMVPVMPPRDGQFWVGFGTGCGLSLLLTAILAAALAFTGFFFAWAQFAASAPAAPGPAALAAPAPDSDLAPAAPDLDRLVADQNAIQDALDDEDFDRAEQLSRALADRHPDDADCRALLQTVRIARAVAAEDVAAADRLLKEAREASMDIDPATELGVGELWLDEGEPDRARIIADRVFKRVSRDGTGEDGYDHYIQGAALVVRGLARAELGDPEGAVADLRAAVKLAPDPETANEWGRYLEEALDKAQ